MVAIAGHGGDRDVDKRAPMGHAAARADLAIVTSDSNYGNPISREAKDLASRAREGKLKPDEYQGGTITVGAATAKGLRFFMMRSVTRVII